MNVKTTAVPATAKGISGKKHAKQRKPVKWHMIWENRGLYLLLVPSVILLLLFSYKPMYGVIIAFKDFTPSKGIWGSEWVGFKHFIKFFKSYQFTSTLKNTLTLSIYGMLATFPLPIIMALFLNQMRYKTFKKFFQTASYLPHFISTVVLVGIILIFLSPGSGLIGTVYKLFGAEAPNLMASASAFKHIYVWSDVWQNTGWDSIVYLAALSSIDPSLYEAAEIDGAGRWQRLKKIDLPLILPTATVLLIMRMGGILGIGYEKVYLMQNSLNTSASEVISTLTYKVGLLNAQYSYSAAIGLFNTVVSVTVMVIVNNISRKVSNSSVW
ncbi:MAG: ABC transporter permease [Faecousia sp.]